MLLTTGVLGASGVSGKMKKISQWGALKKAKAVLSVASQSEEYYLHF